MGAALTAFAGAFRFGAAASENDGAPGPVATIVPAGPTQRPAISTIMPRRDPFAAPVATTVSHSESSEPQPLLPPFPAALKALPPNAGAGTAPFSPASAQHVTAVVTGAHPVALVDDGTTTRVVAPGDLVDGARVARIDATGVHLDAGTTLAAAAPIPPPQPAGKTR
ncbi:MAG TPA: hypothetical protein VHT05_12575 [Candidatus Elarobacter sp.]|nr:hypothetical protein [Candidatus Elarobacter sp.]